MLPTSTWCQKPHRLLDRRLRSWLTEPGSLTRRLLRGATQFSVEPHFQGKARPDREEALLLGLRPGRLAWRRAVTLRRNGEAVITAHTLMPLSSQGELGRKFHGLGRRSLGSLLFANPLIRHGRLAFSRRRNGLWARRALHHQGAWRVLVTEVFLRLP